MGNWKWIFGIFNALFLLESCSTSGSPTDIPNMDGYVGEAACVACHRAQYDDWRGSHHDWAMKKPTAETVLGDFNDQSFTADGVMYYFQKRDSSFYIRTTGDDGQEQEFKVAYTFGVTPLQQYLIQFPDGKYQTLRASWDRIEGKWFNQYAGQEIRHSDWLHWTQGGQRWNTMCAECHSTNLEKNYDTATDTFNTTYSLINVSCEACHGPALEHLQWTSGDTSIHDRKIKVTGFDQNSQLQICAGCHARRVKLTDVMGPDVAWDDQFMIQTINTQYYHADGQIREEDYVMGSFMQSKMYHMDVKCSDCHNPHSMELKMTGNALCLQCHEPGDYDGKMHHFHEDNADAMQCVNCHMTGSVYMGNDFRRDHSFRVPRPDQSVEYGTPNACTGCHEEESDQWAADWIVKWYGPHRADHFSDQLLMASTQEYDTKTAMDVLRFINDFKYPAISRATALQYYPLAGGQIEIEMIKKALTDSSALVRYHALTKFSVFPAEQTLGIALEHIEDSTRLVRIGAAQLMVDQSLDRILPSRHSAVLAARKELTDMLLANADFPLGRMQLGDLYMQQNKLQKAIEEYEMALQMDELLTPVYGNLATAYNLAGQDSLSLATLDRLIALEPEYGRGYYLRGLLKYEMKDVKGAIDDLTLSVQYDPENFRAHYNLANLLLSLQNLNQAELTMKSGLALWPESEEGNYLLGLIYRAQGRDSEAEKTLNGLKSRVNEN
jgi:predicted CXXCH cytochrome family protein